MHDPGVEVIGLPLSSKAGNLVGQTVFIYLYNEFIKKSTNYS